MSRLFLGLEVPGEVRAAVSAQLDAIRSAHDELRWSPPEQWHVTLAFLGEVGVEENEIVDAARPAARSAPSEIDLELAGAGRFGDRVIWFGVHDEPHGAVAQLGASIKRRLGAAGIAVDDRPVRPHITLARSRGRGRAKVTPDVAAALPEVRARWSVNEALLYDSVRRGHREANRYEVRRRIPLGG